MKRNSDSRSSVPAEGPGAENLLATAELESRSREVLQRIEQLDEEQRVLTELRGLLIDEEDSLLSRLRAVRQKLASVNGDLDLANCRKTEIKEEITETQREGELLRSRCSEQITLEHKLMSQLTAAEEEQRALRQQVTSAVAELEVGRSTLLRIDRRLSTGKSRG